MQRSKWKFSLLLITALAITACSAIPIGLTTLRNGLTSTAPLAQAPAATPAPAIQNNSTGQQNAQVSGDVLSALQNTLEGIYGKVSPSVVKIAVTSNVSGGSQNPNSPFNFFGPGGGNQGQGQGQGPVLSGEGSGFIWDKAGRIVTNNHVVDGAASVIVTFSDGFSVTAKVIGTDVNSDLAVIQVNVSQDRLQPVQMADSTQVKVGQLAVAIGNPFGEQGTQTVGFISAIGRSLPVSSDVSTTGASYQIPDVIQTDAPINPGNSGGVLVNDLGQVIGVTAAIESSTNASAGIGFAIPSSIVLRVVPSLIQNGKYTYSWLGISGTDLTSDLAKAMGLNTEQRGVLVGDVTQGGPADKAGIKGGTQTTTINGQQVQTGGDVILAIDGQPTNEFLDLVSYLARATQVGQKVQLTILRNGKQSTVQVTLEARPAQAPQQSPQVPNNNNNNNNNNNQSQPAYLGIIGQTVTAEIAQAMNLNQSQQGVLVEQVQPGSPAEKAGLKSGSQQIQVNGESITVGGDIVTAVDGNAVTSIGELQSTLSQDKPGQVVTLTILRDGKETQVKVTLGSRSG